MYKNKSSKIRIFVGYKDPNIIFESDVYQPIITSQTNWENQPSIIRDNTGINIAAKNKNYAELSGHYWVWKNFLPNAGVDYIGYCHYRRFLDFNITKMENVPFKPISKTEFKKIFKKYTEKNILDQIYGYDIVLPQKILLQGMVYAQYLKWHPMNDMNFALNIIRDYYPEYVETAKDFMASNTMYSCMQFIMKKELFNEYMEWIFDILTKLEEKTDWSEYTNYFNIRTPAYIAERFFNIWLEYNIKVKKLKILNTSSFLLTGKGYGIDEVSQKEYLSRYLEQVELLKLYEQQDENYTLKL